MINYKNNTEEAVYYAVHDLGNTLITCGELAPTLQVSTGNPYSIDIYVTKQEIIDVYGEAAETQLKNEESI